jgi:hypothetical protein
MKYSILLSCCGLLFSTFLAAQKSNTAFAITSEKIGESVWAEVKLIDLNTGKVIRNVFQNKSSYRVFNAKSGRQIHVKDAHGQVTDGTKLPFASFSAACAYDRKNQRLYYTPMFINQLRYIDLKSSEPTIFYFEGENMSGATDLNNEANHITRMVVAADGNGYALNNEATHFVRFTTGKRPAITDLGKLHDDPSNGEFSIHRKETSWGGDMVADAFGNLFLVSAYKSVFKINVDSRTATYMGKIKGLPECFTTNGAVVDNDGNMIVGSASSVMGYFRVDMKTWKASPIQAEGAQVYNASDLANANLAFTDEWRSQQVRLMPARGISRNGRITVYPNPVSDSKIRVSFNNEYAGRFEIQLLDLKGRLIQHHAVWVDKRSNISSMNINTRLSKGMYFVKVLNDKKKGVFSEKIFIE